MDKIQARAVRELDLIIYEVMAELTLQDMLDLHQQMRLGKKSKNLIWDISRGGMNNFSYDDFHRVLDDTRTSLSYRAGGYSVLVSHREIDQLVLKMYKGFAETNPDWPITYHISPNQEVALNWLRERLTSDLPHS
ncbi:hypothetical protein O4H49_02435 [Kiloniella laminariae]|uniref:STAS/SEC14 domain-containing protein n=1 Tax=Kiloniella laminariae TaxID=454162 RepID=A0ABT4LEU1_9PROT|nr:hypothetical protein [Kiloniella laminariae]MCZ4279618.1 hypothetical protein [Kiloniella laminariae]